MHETAGVIHARRCQSDGGGPSLRCRLCCRHGGIGHRPGLLGPLAITRRRTRTFRTSAQKTNGAATGSERGANVGTCHQIVDVDFRDDGARWNADRLGTQKPHFLQVVSARAVDYWHELKQHYVEDDDNHGEAEPQAESGCQEGRNRVDKSPHDWLTRPSTTCCYRGASHRNGENDE